MMSQAWCVHQLAPCLPLIGKQSELQEFEIWGQGMNVQGMVL